MKEVEISGDSGLCQYQLYLLAFHDINRFNEVLH